MSDKSHTAFARNATEPRAMLQTEVLGPQAWDTTTLMPDSWVFSMDRSCRDELDQVLATLRANPIDILLLTEQSFEMPHCTALMAKVKAELDNGILFAVLDRLDMATMSQDEARKLYWILCSLMSKPVAQKFNGSMFFDVQDKKVPVVPGSGIRPTVTNVDLTFHNDNSYGGVQPHYIALLCLGTPLHGGVSKVASVYTVHNRLLAHHADSLARLYRPFWYDRYRECAPDEPGAVQWPLFSFDSGRLESRIALPEIANGHVLVECPIDAEAQKAIDSLKEVFAMDDLAAAFNLQAGQIQIVNNRYAVHSRTEFVDSEDDSHRRHLVRLWLRNEGARTYTGAGPA